MSSKKSQKLDKDATKNMPPWENVLASISRLQAILPEAVLVGGAAAVIHANHRFSNDHDHTIQNLRLKFEEVLQRIEREAGWSTSKISPPVLILGAFYGISTGVRNLMRSAPLEVVDYEIGDITVKLPTADEALRIKAYLAMRRNTTRDYLDIAALSDKIGTARTVNSLSRMDDLYPQDAGPNVSSEWMVRTQIVKQLMQPKPYDLGALDLKEYKGIKPPYDEWSNIKQRCAAISLELLSSFKMALKETNSESSALVEKDLIEWKSAVDRGETIVVPKLPGMRHS